MTNGTTHPGLVIRSETDADTSQITEVTLAEVDGRVIGHGPVWVLPAYQRQGIGKAVIREGLSRLKEMNARGCCLVGHPEYYRKFGFENIPGLVHEGVPPEFFLALSFDGRYPRGTVNFHGGFKADGQPVG